MRSNRINYIAVGMFVLVVGAGLLVALALLTGRTGATDRYYTVYDNVAGVGFGTPVLFEGYPVGQVEKVQPHHANGRTRFRVEISVKQGFPIPEDSTARIASTGLLAGRGIQIDGGSATDVLDAGAMIRPGTSKDVFAVVSRAASRFDELSREGLLPLLDKMNRYVDTLGGLLAERAPGLLDDAQTVTGALAASTPGVTGNLREATERLNADLLSVDNLARIRDTLANLRAASQSLNENLLGPANRESVRAALGDVAGASRDFRALAGDLRRTGARIDAMIAGVDELVAGSRDDIDQSVRDLRYILQAVAENVDAITYNLEGASRNMNEFARAIRQNPGLLLGGRSPAAE